MFKNIDTSLIENADAIQRIYELEQFRIKQETQVQVEREVESSMVIDNVYRKIYRNSSGEEEPV